MEANKSEVEASLKDMGFTEAVINKAYAKADLKTVQGLIHYIDSHPEVHIDDGETQNTAAEPEDKKMAEETTDPQKPEENLIPISGHVNGQFRDNLIAMGYSKNPTEKALFMTQSKSVEAALQWLNDNKDAPDFNEPLFIVGQQGQTGLPGQPKQSNLSPEEAKKQAKALQKQLAAKLKAKDKALEEEREKNRLKMGKELSIAKRKLAEQQKRLDLEYIKREKKEKEDAMAKVLAEIEKDRIARGGKKKEKKLKPAKDVLSDIIHKMKKIYPPGSINGPCVKVCLKTCGFYIGK